MTGVWPNKADRASIIAQMEQMDLHKNHIETNLDDILKQLSNLEQLEPQLEKNSEDEEFEKEEEDSFYNLKYTYIFKQNT